MNENRIRVDIFSSWPAALKEARSVFKKKGRRPEIISDKYDFPHVIIWCKDIEEILDDIIEVSEKFPEETIRICYSSSQSGFRHEIVEICQNGELSIESDVRKKIQS